MRRAVAATTAAIMSAGLLAAVPAGAAAPKPTSPAARQAPYVALAHRLLLKAAVKAKATASFRATGVANVPATASAVVVSVSVPTPIASGTLTFFSYGTKRPATVSLAYAKGRTATATVVLVPGTAGKVSVYNASTKGDNVMATVVGYYAAPGSNSAGNAKTAFVALTPKRLATVVLGKAAASFATGVPATGVAGVVLSVTVPAPAKAGSLSLYGFGAKPSAADFSFVAHHPVTSLVVVPVGAKGRVTVLNHAKTAVRVWVDVVGYLHALKLPSAPRSVVATAQNGGALITWSTPAATGGAPVAAYRIEVLPGGTTMVVPGQALQTSVGSLKNGTAYTFSVVAMNSVGSSPATSSAPVTPYGVPAAPTNVAATPSGIATASLTWTAPTDTGGLPITGYKVTASPGGQTTTSTTTSATVTSLPSGQYSTFTVTATNGPATSLPSAASAGLLGQGVSRVLPNGTTSLDENDAALSADGRFVAFDSKAQLTPADTNTYSDVYLRDRRLGTTTLVSVHTGTADGPSYAEGISDDGRYVAFGSDAHDLVTPATQFDDVYVRDTVNHTTQLVSVNYQNGGEANAGSEGVVISGDGSTVSFSSTANDLVATSNGGNEQVYVETLASRAVRIASVTTGAVPANAAVASPAISADGQTVAFCTTATNLTALDTHSKRQCYINTSEGTQLESYSDATHTGTGDSQSPSLSPDGGFLGFATYADNLAIPGGNGHQIVYLRDLRTRQLTQVTVNLSNTAPTGDSFQPHVSSGGRYVVYTSDAPDLLAGVANGKRQVLRYDSTTGVTRLISASNAGALGDGDSNGRTISPDGLHIAFESGADNLVGGDTNGFEDLFVRDLG